MAKIQQNVSLKLHNTFGIEALAASFASVKSVEDLQELKAMNCFENNAFLVLGGGSNILLSKHLIDSVIHIDIQGITILQEDENHAWIKAGSGVIWHDLVLWAIDKDLSGIENLSLIPGTCGAAPMQNIGAYGADIEQVFESLEAFHIESGELHTFNKKDCAFGYRESVFKRKLKGQYIICSITLRLNKKHQFNISYGDIRRVLDEQFNSEISLQNISKAVIHIRESKLPNPKEIGNSGSFFKNPIIERDEFNRLQSLYPEIPAYPESDGKIKIPAGWLIEKAGWKGKRLGDVGVHQKQALVLVNYGGGSGKEIVELSEKIQADIAQNFGIQLEREVNII